MSRIIFSVAVTALLACGVTAVAVETGDLVEVSAESQSVGRQRPKPGSSFFVLDLHPGQYQEWSDELGRRIQQLLEGKGYVASTRRQAEFLVGYVWGSTRLPDRSVEHVFHVAAVKPSYMRDGQFHARLLSATERSVGDGVFWVGEAKLLDPNPGAGLLDDAETEIVSTLCRGALQRFGYEKSEWRRLYYVPEDEN